MTEKQIIERLTKIENFLLLSDDEIAKKNNVNIKGYENSYKVGWVKSAVRSLIVEIEAKS